MRTYDAPDVVSLVPGPAAVDAAAQHEYTLPYGSTDLEPEYADLLADVERRACAWLNAPTGTRMVLMSGEAMVVLWGALRSALNPGDTVVSVGNGIYGDGIGAMARQCGARVVPVSLPHTRAIRDDDVEAVRATVEREQPRLVTAVYCDTPTGVLNRHGALSRIGALCRAASDCLFYVDAVSAMFGAPLDASALGADLLLCGSQKILSLPPDFGLVFVSPRAWPRMRSVNYAGYDAIAPFENVPPFPYTMSYHSLAAFAVRLGQLESAGRDAVEAAHCAAAQRARSLLRELGVELFIDDDADASPTVTACRVPSDVQWAALDAALRQRKVVLGGSYEQHAGEIFRLGHMGTQARVDLVERAVAALRDALAQLRA